jgi:beta-lactamase regulating signal transducer with metallopeptidase domain
MITPIAPWMVYCFLWSALLALAAILAERVALALRVRMPTRAIWTLSLALSLAIPALAFARARLGPATSANVQSSSAALRDLGLAQSAVARPLAASASLARDRVSADWNALLARIDWPLAAAWFALSLAVFAYIGAGAVFLSVRQRTWREVTVDGTRVLVSAQMGPAIVGVLRPRIVLPAWAIEMNPDERALILAHESEHLRVGDNRLVFAAQLALVCMPWNPALWWQVRRIRLAVELDCDARVVRREAGVRSYIQLLLAVARQSSRAAPYAIGALPLLARAVHLERRIRSLTRPAGPRRLRAAALAGMLAVIVIAAAGAAPVPAARLARDGRRAVVARPAPEVAAVKAGASLPNVPNHRPPHAVPRRAPEMTDSSSVAVGPACYARGDSDPLSETLVQFVVDDEDASNAAGVTIAVRRGEGAGTSVTHIGRQLRDADGTMCSVRDAGMIRFYGQNTFTSVPRFTMVTGRPVTIVVMKASGTVLVEPTDVQPEAGRIELRWGARNKEQ